MTKLRILAVLLAIVIVVAAGSTAAVYASGNRDSRTVRVATAQHERDGGDREGDDEHEGAPAPSPSPAPTRTPAPTLPPTPTKLPPTPTPAPPTPSPTPGPTPIGGPTPTPMPTIDATALYSTYCATCHGQNRQGGIGPALTPTSLSGLTDAQVTAILATGTMSSYASSFSTAQIAAMVQFIKYTAPSGSPTPTPTPPTPTPTPGPTLTRTPTPTPAPTPAPGPTPTPSPTPTLVSFSRVIQPALNAHCTSCHSGTSPAAGVSLTSYSGVRAQVTPGNASSSRLYQAVTGGGAMVGMGFTSTDVQNLANWINQGALNN